MTADRLYLDLLKRVLTYTLWEEGPAPFSAGSVKHPLKRWTAKALQSLLDWRGVGLVIPGKDDPTVRAEGRGASEHALTLIGHARLDNIQRCVERVLEDKIPGDLVETGAWRGGAAIFMRGVLAAHNVSDRLVFVADSFEGCPAPDVATYPQDADETLFKWPLLSVSLEQVQENFRRLGLLDEQVVFLKGWFKDTLPTAPIEKISVLRLDGDMYQSTIEALENLYPKLAPGGFCIIDDYARDNCRQATDDFRAQRGVSAALTEIDWTGVFWRKEHD